MIKWENFPLNTLNICFLELSKNSRDSKLQVRAAKVNKASVFESLRFFCEMFSATILLSDLRLNYLYISASYHNQKAQLQIRHLLNLKVLIFFLLLHENICCGYSLEAPHRGASNEYPQHMFSWRNKKSIMWLPLHILGYEKVKFCGFIVYIYHIALEKWGIQLRLNPFSPWKHMLWVPLAVSCQGTPNE